MRTWTKHNCLLIAILGATLVLRLWGIGYGLPFRFVGDETSLVSGAVTMLKLKTLIPALHPAEFRTLYYPPIGSYLLLAPLLPVLALWYLVSGLPNLAIFIQLATIDPTVVFLTARALAAIAGTATVAVVYAMGHRVGGRRVGMLSAAFLATSFLHLQQSHFLRHWVLTTLAVAVVVWMSLRIAQGGRAADYWWAGIAAGLGFGVSYVPALAFALVFAGHWFNPVAVGKLRHHALWQGLSIFVALAILFVVVHPQEFFRYSVGEGSGAGLAKSPGGLFASLGYHLRNFWNLEPVMFLFTLAGLPMLWRRSRRQFAVLLALPVLYLPALYLLFHDEVRYLLILLPVFAVIAGFALERILAGAAKFAPASALALTLLVAAFPMTAAGKYLWLLSVPDTRQLALVWIAKNVPDGSRVVTDLTTVRLTPTFASLQQQAELDPASLRQEDRALLTLPSARYPQPAYDVLPLHFLRPDVPADLTAPSLERAGFQFLVVEAAATVKPATTALIAAGARPIQQFAADIPDLNGNFRNPLFTIFPARRLGPTVTIYELQSAGLNAVPKLKL